MNLSVLHAPRSLPLLFHSSAVIERGWRGKECASSGHRKHENLSLHSETRSCFTPDTLDPLSRHFRHPLACRWSPQGLKIPPTDSLLLLLLCPVATHLFSPGFSKHMFTSSSNYTGFTLEKYFIIGFVHLSLVLQSPPLRQTSCKRCYIKLPQKT